MMRMTRSFNKAKPRRLGEGLLIGDNIKITVEKISKSEIKIGIETPRDVVVCREEVVKKENVL